MFTVFAMAFLLLSKNQDGGLNKCVCVRLTVKCAFVMNAEVVML